MCVACSQRRRLSRVAPRVIGSVTQVFTARQTSTWLNVGAQFFGSPLLALLILLASFVDRAAGVPVRPLFCVA